MDNEQERNEHFKGFAELLWNDLYQVAGTLMVDTTPHEWDEIIAQLKILIAQRAYDLVYFLLDKAPLHSGSFDVGWGSPSEIQEAIERLPDLTSWPKTASE